VFRLFFLFIIAANSLFALDANETTKIIDSVLKITEDSNISMVDSLELTTIIDRFNSMPIFASINRYLGYINVDIGRLVLFALIIMVSYLLRNIGQLIFPALRKIFPETEDIHDDLEVDDFLSLREPLSFLVKLFGVNLAISILYYPNDIGGLVDTIIYIAYVIGFARFFIIFFDILFDAYFVSRYKRKNRAFRKELVNLIKQVIKAITIIVAFLLILRALGVDITGFVASLGLGGLMIAMASKDTVSNFFGSLKIIFDESFSQGDWIKVGDVEGTVVELGFISTKIRTFDNALISLPNAKLANEAVKNYNRRKVGRRVKMLIGVTYDAKRENLLKAVQEIKSMLQNHPDIATKNEMSQIGRRKSLIESSDLQGVKSTLLVNVDSFGDSSINILVYAFSKTTNWKNWLEVKEDVMMKIWKILEENDLEMAFPTQTVHLKGEK
jgi:MscS family membrane protein